MEPYQGLISVPEKGVERALYDSQITPYVHMGAMECLVRNLVASVKFSRLAVGLTTPEQIETAFANNTYDLAMELQGQDIIKSREP